MPRQKEEEVRRRLRTTTPKQPTRKGEKRGAEEATSGGRYRGSGHISANLKNLTCRFKVKINFKLNVKEICEGLREIQLI